VGNTNSVLVKWEVILESSRLTLALQFKGSHHCREMLFQLENEHCMV